MVKKAKLKKVKPKKVKPFNEKRVISSYPNDYFMSKHQRFRPDHICACACDCDWILRFSKQKGGELCMLCSENSHAVPIYKKKFQVEHKKLPKKEKAWDE